MSSASWRIKKRSDFVLLIFNAITSSILRSKQRIQHPFQSPSALPPYKYMHQQPQTIARCRDDSFCRLSPKHPVGSTLMRRQKQEEEVGK